MTSKRVKLGLVQTSCDVIFEIWKYCTQEVPSDASHLVMSKQGKSDMLGLLFQKNDSSKQKNMRKFNQQIDSLCR